MDDILLTENDLTEIQRGKDCLLQQFRIKDLGDLKYFIGIEFSCSKAGIYMSQRKYALDILQDTGLTGARPDKFPMEQHLKLTSDDEELLKDPVKYRRLVGRLIYLTVTRADIAFSVQTLSQYIQDPRKPHWDSSPKVHQRITRTRIVIAIRKQSAYCDSDWGGCQTTRRSVSGYCIFSWFFYYLMEVKKTDKRIKIISAMAYTCLEIVWLQYLLQDLDVPCKLPAQIFCDNQATLHITANPLFHERTKHIEIDCRIVREKLQVGIISLHMYRHSISSHILQRH